MSQEPSKPASISQRALEAALTARIILASLQGRDRLAARMELLGEDGPERMYPPSPHPCLQDPMEAAKKLSEFVACLLSGTRVPLDRTPLVRISSESGDALDVSIESFARSALGDDGVMILAAGWSGNRPGNYDPLSIDRQARLALYFVASGERFARRKAIDLLRAVSGPEAPDLKAIDDSLDPRKVGPAARKSHSAAAAALKEALVRDGRNSKAQGDEVGPSDEKASERDLEELMSELESAAAGGGRKSLSLNKDDALAESEAQAFDGLEGLLSDDEDDECDGERSGDEPSGSAGPEEGFDDEFLSGLMGEEAPETEPSAAKTDAPKTNAKAPASDPDELNLDDILGDFADDSDEGQPLPPEDDEPAGSAGPDERELLEQIERIDPSEDAGAEAFGDPSDEPSDFPQFPKTRSGPQAAAADYTAPAPEKAPAADPDAFGDLDALADLLGDSDEDEPVSTNSSEDESAAASGPSWTVVDGAAETPPEPEPEQEPEDFLADLGLGDDAAESQNPESEAESAAVDADSSADGSDEFGLGALLSDDGDDESHESVSEAPESEAEAEPESASASTPAESFDGFDADSLLEAFDSAAADLDDEPTARPAAASRKGKAPAQEAPDAADEEAPLLESGALGGGYGGGDDLLDEASGAAELLDEPYIPARSESRRAESEPDAAAAADWDALAVAAEAPEASLPAILPRRISDEPAQELSSEPAQSGPDASLAEPEAPAPAESAESEASDPVSDMLDQIAGTYGAASDALREAASTFPAEELDSDAGAPVEGSEAEAVSDPASVSENPDTVDGDGPVPTESPEDKSESVDAGEAFGPEAPSETAVDADSASATPEEPLEADSGADLLSELSGRHEPPFVDEASCDSAESDSASDEESEDASTEPAPSSELETACEASIPESASELTTQAASATLPTSRDTPRQSETKTQETPAMAGEWTVDATSTMDGAEALLEAFASGGAGEIQVDPAGDGFKASASAPSAAVAAKLAAKAIALGATAKMRRS